MFPMRPLCKQCGNRYVSKKIGLRSANLDRE